MVRPDRRSSPLNAAVPTTVEPVCLGDDRRDVGDHEITYAIAFPCTKRIEHQANTRATESRRIRIHDSRLGIRHNCRARRLIARRGARDETEHQRHHPGTLLDADLRHPFVHHTGHRAISPGETQCF